MAHFAAVSRGASLMVANKPADGGRRTALIVGANALAAARALACLDAGYTVTCLPIGHDAVDAELLWRAQHREIRLEAATDELADWLDHSDNSEIIEDVAFVILTDTIASPTSTRARPYASAQAVRQLCQRRRIPISIADMPALSDFSFPATHRFPLADGKGSPLQVALTTNSSSCRLAARLRRMIVAALPREVGSAVARIRELREAVRKEQAIGDELLEDEEGVDESWSTKGPLNKPVDQLSFARSARLSDSTVLPLTPPLTPPITAHAFPPRFDRTRDEPALTALTRMRFIAQICACHSDEVLTHTAEYWPLDRIANMAAKDIARVLGPTSPAAPTPSRTVSPCRSRRMAALSASTADQPALSFDAAMESNAAPTRSTSNERSSSTDRGNTPRHDLALDDSAVAVPARRGQVILLGSGPGSPGLLTVAAHELLTRRATCVLSDKLVPSAVLALIPPHIPLTIAKKFPGNAEGAQSELMELGLEAARRGEIVVRLKQGDPLLFGRGGEEVLFFRKHGFEPVLVPGITSAFAAPALANIPVTQRGVAESVVVCTGVGRGGKGVNLPGYERARCLVILMGVARLRGVVHALISAEGLEAHGREGGKGREGLAYPPHLPIAIVERASSKDQRVVASTLEKIADAMDRVEAASGGQRPPGMMVVGWSVLALEGEGDITVLDSDDNETTDRARVDRWLGGKDWIEREGLPQGWDAVEVETADGAPSLVGPMGVAV